MAKDYTTIRVPRADKETAAAAKRDGETWGEYLQRCTDNAPEETRVIPADEIEAQIQTLQDTAFDHVDRLGKIEQTLEELQAGRY